VLGSDRSYVYLGPKFSAAAWIAAQKAGRNFVTNGPMLAFTVNGALPGTVLPDNAGEVDAALHCESRDELEHAEIVMDGETVGEFSAAAGAMRITAQKKLRPRSGSWILGRCFEKNSATVRFAHSSPIYVGPSARRSAAAQAYLRDWVNAEMARLERVPSELLAAGQKAEMLDYCRKARERYQ